MDEIDIQRRLAAQQMAQGSDFSPVGHVTQGLARVASVLAGSLQMRRADRATEERSAAHQIILQELMKDKGVLPDGSDPVAAALADPELRDIGLVAMKARQPQAEDVPEIVQLARIANDLNRPDWERQAAADRVAAINDPMTNVAIGDLYFSGRTSQLPNVLADAGYTAVGTSAPSAPPPEAIQELISDPSPDAIREFNEVFGAGQAESLIQARQNFSAGATGPVITRAQAESMIREKGRSFFDAWAARNNVTVGN